ncbi:tetratricopeptide repeat protein [Streptomyces qinzhouensis]|uniref:Tetratricopeptide repeat protein n=1 Tax=Streptomyces qinzhouensis TaxID=2599401 RepID=A0A5B8J9Y3_9ACTN|nr:hypothetical protein [Streptomyces qinzhouensis]QDY78157.1 hypothetical protein FQU76_18545 [Streptomyces qinzhouensis]
MRVPDAVLDRGYAKLAPGVRRAYRFLGSLPGTVVIDADLIGALVTVDWDTADSVLRTLADHDLAEPCAPGARRERRYRLTAPAHARRLTTAHDTSEEQRAAVRRMCEWITTCALIARQQLLPRNPSLASPDTDRYPVPFADDGAMTWLNGHRPTLRTALWATTTHGWDTLGWQLVHGMWPLLTDKRPVSLWAEAAHLGLAAARRTGHGWAEREMLFCGATGLLTFGATADALGWFTELKQSARTARDDHDEGRGAFGQALCHHQDARADTALFCLDQAITLWDACGNHDGTALASLTAGEITLEGDDLPRATALLTRAYDLLPPPDTSFEATCALALLGQAHLQAGHHEQGIAELHEALKVFEHDAEIRWQVRVLGYLAREATVHEDEGLAQHLLQQAAALDEPPRPGEKTARLLARLP